MCNDPSLFTWLKDKDSRRTVSVGNGKKSQVIGIGTVLCSSIVDCNPITVELKDVLCVSSLICNLISVSRIRKSGLRVTFDTDKVGDGVCDIPT